ncbi:DinB family protein [Alkalibacillus aidingensis]|uniref:DinB family protein n=1 Tax=Alkalibacillus aidingensis TaxID=2747607 RepID=UPI0016614F3F|nr:DinB family protein [Alkalibacillus aidingensis]
MYRTVSDFVADWSQALEGTTMVFEAMTDEQLDQAIVEGHSSLGWLGWHLATSPVFFASVVGIKLETNANPEKVPNQASQIVDTYKQVANELKEKVEQELTDEQLEEKVEGFGTQLPRGAVLRTLIDHQTHHRGQMTVLLRQAGLPVPGVMGPTKEDQQ